MKKLNRKGFILAETLVVTVFLMVLFGMIYTTFLPLIGEYEKREVYDDIDGKYSVYWIKRMIESEEYSFDAAAIERDGYVRFQCKDFPNSGDGQAMCKDIVTILQINSCNNQGNYCDIYITKYKIKNNADTSVPWFKNVVKTNLKRSVENCTGTASACRTAFLSTCEAQGDLNVNCTKLANQNVFTDGFKDYMIYLPDYILSSPNNAKYRVFIVIHNKKDSNNYYSYATIEVNRP